MSDKFKNVIIIVLMLVIVIGGCFVLSFMQQKDYKFTLIDLDTYFSLKKENKTSLIYISKEDCAYCAKETPILKEIGEEKNLKIYQINLSSLTSDEKNQLAGSDDYLKDGYSVPLLVITKDDEFVDQISGYHTKDKIINFLEENDIL